MKNFFRFHEFHSPSDKDFENSTPRKYFLEEIITVFSLYKLCGQFGRQFCGQLNY